MINVLFSLVIFTCIHVIGHTVVLFVQNVPSLYLNKLCITCVKTNFNSYIQYKHNNAEACDWVLILHAPYVHVQCIHSKLILPL